ncbi:MAG: efflux transporter outer membrane subunit [Deltaproteobacteria bacterium]|nr:efflux transporter outer membrane subunit [Deltaproteobacteria bacterium]
MSKKCLVLLFAIILTSCSVVGPDFAPPTTPTAQDWLVSQKDGVKAEPAEIRDWWKHLNDPALDELIQKAYSQNLSLKTAGLRVLQAKATLAQSVGNLYPLQQRLDGNYVYNRFSEHASGVGTDTDLTQNQLGLSVGWEIDFWGKFRRAVESQDAALLASAASYDTVLVALLGQVATSYINVRTLEERIRIARDNVTTQRKSSRIAQVRFNTGMTSERDYQQALTQLHATEASIPQLELALQQTKNALSLLLGEAPGYVDQILAQSKSFIPNAPNELIVGIPSELIRRRPDIRAAEFNAAAQCAAIGVQEAELYPAFSLSGSFGFLSTDASPNKLKNVAEWKSHTATVGPSVQWNFFNYGQITNAIRVQDAAFQQALVDYENTVRSAQREVEDGLVAFTKSQREVELRKLAVEAAQRTLNLVTVQYDTGATDYTTVISAQQSLLGEQDSLAKAKGAVPQALVTVYSSLGGGWQIRENNDFVSDATKEQMRKRTDWGALLEPAKVEEAPSRTIPTW